MFTDQERDELVLRLMMVLDRQKAGRADARKDLAELLADTTREYLKGRYSSAEDTAKKFGTQGIVQTRDVLSEEDFGRS